MSSDAQLTQEEARQIIGLKADAERIRRERLEAAGLAEQFDLWRESMPNTLMDDNEVYNVFMNAQVGEEAAQQGTLGITSDGAELEPPDDMPVPGPGSEESARQLQGPGTEIPETDVDPATGKAAVKPEPEIPVDPTALKRVEGMWVPPEEAAAENYEEPTTYMMSRSEDWIKEAKVLYEFMGRPLDEHPTVAGGGPLGFSAAQVVGKPKRPATDSQIGQWAREQMSSFNWNVVDTMSYAQKIMTSEDPDLALSFLNLINMYDHSDGGAAEFGGALGEIALDPTTYLGLGVGSVVAKGAAKATAKTALKKAIQYAIVGGSAGGVEGGVLAGGFDLVKQNVEQEAGARDDIDYGRAGLATGLGVGLGVMLGAAGGGFAGRQMDIFAARVAEEKKLTKARDVFLDESAMKEMGLEELTDLMGSLISTEVKAGRSDLAVRMATAIRGETGDMPRLADGSVDYKKIMQIVDEIAGRDVRAQAGAAAKAIKDKLDTVVDVTNSADMDMHLEAKSGALEMTVSDTPVYQGIEEIATEIGLKTAAIERDGGFFLRIEGSDKDLLDFIYKMHEVPEAMSPELRAKWAEILPAEDKSRLAPVVTIERAGYKVTLGEEGDILFELKGMPEADIEKIHTAAEKAGVFPSGEAYSRPKGNRPRSGPDEYVTVRGDEKSMAKFAEILSGQTEELRWKGQENLPPIKEVMQSRVDAWAATDETGEIILTNRPDLEARGDELSDPNVHHAEGGPTDSGAPQQYQLFDNEGQLWSTWRDPEEAMSAYNALKDAEGGNPIIIDTAGKPPSTPKALPSEGRQFRPDIMDEDSQKLVNKILEMEELEKGDVVLKTPDRPGSRVTAKTGETMEVVGRTQNGWYRLRDQLGREVSLRRKGFDVVEKAPAPRRAGPMELNPFSSTAAKIIALNEIALSPEFKLRPVATTHKEQEALVDLMAEAGIDITGKPIDSHWTPAELLFLRDTYEAQTRGMAELATELRSKLTNDGRVIDGDLARFNDAHAILVATRDLFYGTSGNAARQMNILRSKPREGVYDFSQAMMDSISLQGGRANTERAIRMMADFASKEHGDVYSRHLPKQITDISTNIWGNPTAALLLNVRYNMMLSSWRTHFYNFLGNSASGVYQHLMVSPVRMGINNLNHARQIALSVVSEGKLGMPDPADRMIAHNYYAELRGHFAGARDSLMLAKEIALGRDIGEGKVWNELGLRYNVINVPSGMLGKIGTTPVRVLEAGDAFFKNQYYNSKMHEFASIRARRDEVYDAANFKERYDYYLENPDELGGAAEREARAFAAKQTYTNDPSVYGGVLAAVAEGVSKMQNKSLMVNMIIPFVRTPANLLSYSMEMIGANTVLSPAKTYNTLMHGTQRESQEALARLTVAAGLWLMVSEAYQNGSISGTGPGNWEERKVWMAAGWQPNSIKVHGHWVSIERASPAGLSLATIASVFDYYSMVKQQNKPAMEWIAAGLLYTADMIMDESYISSAVDVLTAISSKEPGRFQAAAASMINSTFVPNILRDLRRPDDEAKRNVHGVNLLDAMHKQIMNATPGYLDIGQGNSTELPPSIDWKGDVMNYWGNAYQRGLIPFNIRDASDTDPASMALAYARIPISRPNKTLSWPGGLGDSIDLWAMDNGGGFVYNEYEKIMGKQRKFAVDTLMETRYWDQLVEDNNIGPGTEGDMALREALGMATKFGRLEMLNFLIDHSGDNDTYSKVGPDGNPMIYQIQHPVSVDTYIELQRQVREQRINVPDDQSQYIIQKPSEGPEFFRP